MRAPEFWHSDNWASRLLEPLGSVYAWAVARRLAEAKEYRPAVPVICVGNIVTGGAGKTPVCLALVERLRARGRHPHLLTRGYGGTEVGPRAVDSVRHDATRVGDEALLLAAHAPTWVARWRPDGAVAAVEMGADILVMDDGFQNPTMVKDLSLVVVDGGYGFGNGRVMPAGPCRESIRAGLARADAVVLIGDDRAGVACGLGDLPVLRARLVPGPEAEGCGGRPGGRPFLPRPPPLYPCRNRRAGRAGGKGRRAARHHRQGRGAGAVRPQAGAIGLDGPAGMGHTRGP